MRKSGKINDTLNWSFEKINLLKVSNESATCLKQRGTQAVAVEQG